MGLKFEITKVNGDRITGEIVGYGGHIQTEQRAREHITRLQRLQQRGKTEKVVIETFRDQWMGYKSAVRVELEPSDISEVAPCSK